MNYDIIINSISSLNDLILSRYPELIEFSEGFVYHTDGDEHTISFNGHVIYDTDFEDLDESSDCKNILDMDNANEISEYLLSKLYDHINKIRGSLFNE